MPFYKLVGSEQFLYDICGSPSGMPLNCHNIREYYDNFVICEATQDQIDSMKLFITSAEEIRRYKLEFDLKNFSNIGYNNAYKISR